jgi:hypothetical protein
MGAWGEKAFQNDAALDWLAELATGGVAALRSTLSRVADSDQEDEVDVDDGSSAIAAAEIVAAALGRGKDRLTMAANAWLDAHHGALSAEDLKLANRAVRRVLSEGSELRALWDENDSDFAWHSDVGVLLERLTTDADPDASAAIISDARKPTGPGKAHLQSKQVLVTFLRARGLEPTPQQWSRIHASEDTEELQRWLARAIEAPSVAAVLDE